MATSKYAYFNTKSSSDWLTSWILHGRRTFLEDVCVAFFNVPTWKQRCHGAKPPHGRTKPSRLQPWQWVLTGSTKCLIFKSMWNMLSSRHSLQEFYTLVCNCGDISMALKMAWHKWNVIGCFTCQSYVLLGGPWPFKVAKVPRPSAVSLKVWLHETNKCSMSGLHIYYIEHIFFIYLFKKSTDLESTFGLSHYKSQRHTSVIHTFRQCTIRVSGQDWIL